MTGPYREPDPPADAWSEWNREYERQRTTLPAPLTVVPPSKPSWSRRAWAFVCGLFR